MNIFPRTLLYQCITNQVHGTWMRDKKHEKLVGSWSSPEWRQLRGVHSTRHAGGKSAIMHSVYSAPPDWPIQLVTPNSPKNPGSTDYGYQPWVCWDPWILSVHVPFTCGFRHPTLGWVSTLLAKARFCPLADRTSQILVLLGGRVGDPRQNTQFLISSLQICAPHTAGLSRSQLWQGSYRS